MSYIISAEEIQRRGEIKHANKYVYHLDTYKGTQKLMSITCPIHGKFEQRPVDHCAGQGCPKCGVIKRNINSLDNTDKFIKKALFVHGDTYDYSLVEYTKSNKKVKIICLHHGVFEQRAGGHIQGKGCPICNKPIQKTTDSFIAEAKLVHGDKYDYSKVVYKNIDTPIIIVCPNHGSFVQSPYGHLKGNQCSQCSNYGFKRNLPAILYYLRITKPEGIFYKIGITNKSVEDRYLPKEMASIKILQITNYATGQEAYEEEQNILRKFLDYKYDGPKLLDSGNTEILIKDVLEIDLI